jgi:flagellar biosynthesis protein FlhG
MLEPEPVRSMQAAAFPAYCQPARAVPSDQADGLRRLFAGHAHQQVLPLVANPHVAFAGVVLDRLAAVLSASGRQVLVVDAGAGAPEADELARLNLAMCIERLAPRVAYLPARGLPLSFVDTRGSAGGFIDAVLAAAPWADTVLLHAEGFEMARLLVRRNARPLLIGADHPESIKHAYASAKLLVRRCGLMGFDLMLAASSQSPRVASIAQSLSQCLDNFLGAWLHHSALIDPAADVAAPADAALHQLLTGQLTLETLQTPEAPAWLPAAMASQSAVSAAFSDSLHFSK